MAVALFISPHPDDESLSMGMGIANHIWYGNEVYLMLLCRGNGSDAIDVINGKIYCGWHNRYHSPTSEGYSPLDIDQFSNARLQEFRYSAACLGVKPENLIIYKYSDGEIKRDIVKERIKEFLSSHPYAAVKTPSVHDIHPDHAECGYALLDMYNSGDIKDARFYISPAQWSDIPGNYEYNQNCRIFHQASLGVYKRWNPAYGIFGIGYHSVSSLFDNVSATLRSKYQTPDDL